MKIDPDTITLFGDEAQSALMKGVDLVCRAASTTLGPKGANSAIDYEYKVSVQHDGVITSLAVRPKEPFAALGAKIAHEVGKKQRDIVGDGTTLSYILLEAITSEARKATGSGTNRMTLRKGLESGTKKVIAELTKLATPVRDLKQMIQIATISAEDPELGRLIAETLHKIGPDGIMTIDESKAEETFVEIQDGMQLERGWAHEFMVTDPDKMTADLDDTHILITDIPLNSIAEIAGFLNDRVIGKGVLKMVFISPEVSGDFLTALYGAKFNGKFLPLAVRAPLAGAPQSALLQDLCAVTGAKFVSKEAGHKLSDIDLSWCGRVSHIKSTKLSTIITGGSGHKQDILARIAGIKKQMEDHDLSDYEREKLRERYGKLTNGIAVLKVGGQTEVEMNERRERADDAIKATQAAVKSGIVSGGETSLLSARAILIDSTELGEVILYHALSKPFEKLMTNAGHNAGEKLEQWSNKPDGIGFDVVSEKWTNMIKAGIIDPLAVPVTAVKTAVSVGNQLISIECAIVPEPKDEKKT